MKFEVIRQVSVAGGGTIVYGRINRMSGPPIAVDDRRVEKMISRADQLFVSQSQVYVKCERRHICNRLKPPMLKTTTTETVQEVAMKTLGSFLERPSRALARIIAAIAITSLLLLGAALMARPAPAQSADAGLPRAALVELLGDGYAEVPVAFGLAGNGGLIEVFASADGATWTMVLSMPNGLSYVVTTGEGWTPVTAGGRRIVTRARSAAAGPFPRRKNRAAK